MVSMHALGLRAALAGLSFCIALGSAGCSGGSADSTSRLSVREADQETLKKFAEGRKQRALEKASLPKSKQKSFD